MNRLTQLLAAAIVALLLFMGAPSTANAQTQEDTTHVHVTVVTANDRTVYEPTHGKELLRAALDGRCGVLEARERENAYAHVIATKLVCPESLVESAKSQN